MSGLIFPFLLSAAIILFFPLIILYLSLVERKILADFQVRLGPMRVGPHGLLQPVADALKLLLKEDLIPREADRAIFWAAPIVTTFSALTAFSVLPFSGWLVVADVNIGLLVISATGAVGVLGIVLGGWASNSHYPLLGALRSSAQLVSYEVALGLALLAPVMSAGTLSMVEIVRVQQQRGLWLLFDNYGLLAIPFVIFMIAAVAEVNRTPFDLPEAESELVAGFHTEFSGFRWALFMLGEYANTVVMSGVAVTIFLGGWLRPFSNTAWLDIPIGYVLPAVLLAGSGAMCLPMARRLDGHAQRVGLYGAASFLIVSGGLLLIPGINAGVTPLFWFFFKVGLIIYVLIWVRATLPRFRYDQLMNIGWKILIPIGLFGVFGNAIVGTLKK